jgi:hypothetical protein
LHRSCRGHGLPHIYVRDCAQQIYAPTFLPLRQSLELPTLMANWQTPLAARGDGWLLSDALKEPTKQEGDVP